jgi:hypothetical protein
MMLLIQWLFVHLFTDFVLQTSSMVRHKRRLKARSWTLYVHCLLHGGLIYLITANWQGWQIPLIVAVTHYFINLWKLYRKDNLAYFIADQAMHIMVLVLLWCIVITPPGWLAETGKALKNDLNFWLVAAGYLFVTFPLSLLMYYATQRWRRSVEQGDWGKSSSSLSEAGKWIGIFERLLVYTFVVTNHFEGIGFLIAAKSVLRFNDLKGADARKETEYVLIGTLMSFSFSIITGLLVRLGMN